MITLECYSIKGEMTETEFKGELFKKLWQPFAQEIGAKFDDKLTPGQVIDSIDFELEPKKTSIDGINADIGCYRLRWDVDYKTILDEIEEQLQKENPLKNEPPKKEKPKNTSQKRN
jgi:hypothetical protein